MIHPTENYVVGYKISMMLPRCPFEGKDIEVKEYARDPETEIHYYTAQCMCAWPGTNLQYLEYLYEKTLCK